MENTTLMAILEFMERQIESKYKALVQSQKYVKPREYRSEKLDELTKDLSKLQGELNDLCVNKENPFYKSMYLDLHGMMQALRPLLPKYNLAIGTHIETDDEDIVTAHVDLLHTSDQWIKSVMRIKPTTAKQEDTGKAISYAKRYMIGSLLGITSSQDKDDDDGAADSNHAQQIFAKGTSLSHNKKVEKVGPSITKSELADLQFILKGWPDIAQSVLNHYDLNSLGDLPESEFTPVRERIQKIISLRTKKDE